MTPEQIRNLCPVCKKPRGVGSPYEFNHGNCMEIRAQTEGKESAYPGKKGFETITKDQLKKSKDNSSKKVYLSGKLPKWMLN